METQKTTKYGNSKNDKVWKLKKRQSMETQKTTKYGNSKNDKVWKLKNDKVWKLKKRQSMEAKKTLFRTCGTNEHKRTFIPLIAKFLLRSPGIVKFVENAYN